jgi:lipid II:glycine glycyltransferase (peptidoglycan interpeptide bridge formation enzyme)
MAHYYQLHLRTRMKHGMPAQPQRFFFALWDSFASSGTVQLLLAEYEGTIIAGMILVMAGTTVKYGYGASDERYLQLAPNNLLLWTAITQGCTQGYQLLDLGRTARDNQGLMEFKRRWGAYEEQLLYYYYPANSGLTATSERSWKYRLLTNCWKRLPLQVAGALGGSIYKHLG